MTIYQVRTLLNEIKRAIQYENNHANYQRVQWLKMQQLKIKAKLKNVDTRTS